LERYQYEDVCLADLEERPGAYMCFGTEEEIQRHMEGLATQREEKNGELARLAAQVEEGQRSYAENVHRLDVVNGLIAKRHARERELEFGGEEEGYESGLGEHWHETEYAAHGANKVLGRKLAI
jgi:flagellar biosynthesis chaperone FliJ